METNEILNQIGAHGKILRVKRDDLGLISSASLFDPRFQSDVLVDVKQATLLTGTINGFKQLGKLTPHRNMQKLGFLEIGCPDDGSEWYVHLQ